MTTHEGEGPPPRWPDPRARVHARAPKSEIQNTHSDRAHIPRSVSKPKMKQRHELMVRQIKPSKRSVDARGPNTLGEKGIEPRGGRAARGVLEAGGHCERPRTARAPSTSYRQQLREPRLRYNLH